MVFENRVLRRTFGTKRYEVIAGWRKLHNGDHHKWYSLPSLNDDAREDEMDRACSMHFEIRNSYRTLVGKPERGRLGRPSNGRIIIKRFLEG
jgi:hypothetical protein